MTTLLRLQNVAKAYANGPVLYRMSLDIKAGEFFTLLGPSGCGKTTLLRIISGLTAPDAGEIYLNHQPISRVPAEQRPIHTVFQQYALFPHLNVWDNVAFGLRYLKNPPTDRHAQIEQMLTQVRMLDRAHQFPHELSGGQQQRVAIARAVIQQPKLLLLDEPMSALDYPLRKAMRIELKNLQAKLGITFVLVTHDREEALSLADRVAVMQAGRLTQIDTPRDLYEKPVNRSVAAFIGEANFFPCHVERADPDDIHTTLEGVPLRLPNRKHHTTGASIDIMVRPEDLNVWHENEVESTVGMLPGRIMQVIYKGSTVDLVVRLRSGQIIHATEFFDENDDKLLYTIDQPVWLNWIHGWETLFNAQSV